MFLMLRFGEAASKNGLEEMLEILRMKQQAFFLDEFAVRETQRITTL